MNPLFFHAVTISLRDPVVLVTVRILRCICDCFVLAVTLPYQYAGVDGCRMDTQRSCLKDEAGSISESSYLERE